MCLSGSSGWETQKSTSEGWAIKRKNKTKPNLLERNEKRGKKYKNATVW